MCVCVGVCVCVCIIWTNVETELTSLDDDQFLANEIRTSHMLGIPLCTP